MAPTDHFTLEVSSAHSSASELEDATLSLRDDIELVAGLDVSERRDPAPAGSKAGVLISTGQLLISVLGPAGLAISITGVLKDWLLRHKDFKIKLKRPDGAEIEMAGTSPKEVKAVVEQIDSWFNHSRGYSIS